MLVFRLPLIALWLVGFAAPGVQADRPPAPQIARTLQQKYDQVRNFTAHFTHTYTGGVLNKTLTESGTVSVSKPGRMRWEYTSPEKKLFVSDGVRMYSYVPEDKQVIVSAIPREDEATTAALFLAGKGNLTRDFTVSYAEKEPTGTWALRLQPKERQRDYDWLILAVDRDSFEIRVLIAEDTQGGRSEFRFTDLKQNVEMPDKLFTFKIPKGVDVITAGSPER
jgi:outer membrane lipoprotein carrier protein